MKFIIHGALGRMGQAVEKFLVEENQEFIKVDINYQEGQGYRAISEVKEKVDCIIDFSFHTVTESLLEYAVKTNTPIIVATTGHTEEEKAKIYTASNKVAVFYSGNMSVGIALMSDLVKKVVKAMPKAEVEIIETHHDKKIDAPSGTALMLFNAVKEEREQAFSVVGRNGHSLRQENEVGISSIRLCNVVGIHEVIISNGVETITLKHEAHDRALFASGAVKAAMYLAGKSAGLYDMKKLLRDN